MSDGSRSWTDWYWLVFLVVAVGLGFGVPELLAITDGDPATDPLTNWTIERGLGELAAVLGLWLGLHFGIREIRRRHSTSPAVPPIDDPDGGRRGD